MFTLKEAKEQIAERSACSAACLAIKESNGQETMVRLTMNSKNSKTGPIPQIYAERATCPKSCPHYSGTCYALTGHVSLVWLKKFPEYKIPLSQALDQIAALPSDSIWRYGVAGDLPGKNESIRERELQALIDANSEKNGFAYTHKTLTEENIALLQYANQEGFTVNISCETRSKMELAADAGLPVVRTVAADCTEYEEIGGLKPLVCPHETNGLQCRDCGLCAQSVREFYVVFHAHGVRKAKVKSVIAELED